MYFVRPSVRYVLFACWCSHIVVVALERENTIDGIFSMCVIKREGFLEGFFLPLSRMSMPKAFAILAMAGSAFAEEYGLYEPAQNEARFFFFNSTGSAQTLSLLGAAILIAVIAYLVFASTGTEGSYYNRNDYEYDPYAQQDYGYAGQYR